MKIIECENNLHKTWGILKSILKGGTSTFLQDEFCINNKDNKDKNYIANKFNEYFIEIGSKLAANISPTGTSFMDYLKNPMQFSIGIELTSPDELLSIANNLKLTNNEGVDKINPKIAGCSIEPILAPLPALINCSLCTGVVPDCLKLAKVIPVFKTGDKKQIGNYRPISVLPYFSKCFEKVMYTRLMSFITAKHILFDGQFGFRKGFSTYMAVLEMCDKISEARDNNMFSIGVFFDLSKAFDTVNHEILLKKLEYYGIRGMGLIWLENYLKNRSQYVLYNGSSSHILAINCGVPQGSILGPLLFLLYINDIHLTSSILQFIMFADDTNVFMSDNLLPTLIRNMNEELAKVEIWFKANKLSLNLNKTNYILFTSKKKMSFVHEHEFSISIDNQCINRVTSAKFLGVYIRECKTGPLFQKPVFRFFGFAGSENRF